MSGKLLIGWAETDITPEGIVDLSGQYYHRLSAEVHLPLSATVLALESSGEQAVMVSLDLIGCEANFQEELRAELRNALPEFDAMKLFLNAIHTHNAPAVDFIPGIGWIKEPENALSIASYRKFILKKLVAAVSEAWRSRKQGAVARAFGSARIGHCRRAAYANDTAEMYGDTGRTDFMCMEAGEDSGVEMLFTFDEAKKPTGMILNVACPSQVMEATYKISSDYMGETRRLLKTSFGEGFKTLCQISAAGCQSPRDLTRNYNGSEPDFWHEDGVACLGQRLRNAICEAFPQTEGKLDFTPAFHHCVENIALPRRRASCQDFIDAQRKLKELEAVMGEEEAYLKFCEEVASNEKIPGRPGPYDSKLHHFVLIQNNKEVVNRYLDQDKLPTFNFEAHLLRLGDVAFATNPFELYLEFGQRIKARSKAKQTFLVQLCCGIGGYLPSALAEKLGGYGGLIINGQVGSDGGSKLVEETVKSLNELFT